MLCLIDKILFIKSLPMNKHGYTNRLNKTGVIYI